MVRKIKKISIFIHLCCCNEYVEIVKHIMKIYKKNIEENNNYNVIPLLEEYPFLHFYITPREKYGVDLKFTIPVKVDFHAVLRQQCGYYYYIVKYVYNKKWITQYIEYKIYWMLRDSFYQRDSVSVYSKIWVQSYFHDA